MQGLWDDITGWAGDVWDATPNFLELGEEYYNEGKDYALVKLNEAISLMNNLAWAQETVDTQIANLPEGPDKQRLISKRDEARGFFEEYVIPAWVSVAGYFGLSKQPGYQSYSAGLGVEPLTTITVGLISAAALGAVAAFIYYAKRSYDQEERILNDPALAQVLSQSKAGGIGAAIVSMKWPLIILGVGSVLAVGYKYYQPFQKRLG